MLPSAKLIDLVKVNKIQWYLPNNKDVKQVQV
jgi:hypothetical protein